MKDPIERQAAIDAIERNACNTQRAIDAVIGLPSAQQVRTEMSSADDLISRQVAIDALNNADVVVLYHENEPIDEAIEEAILATKRSAEKSIEALPSAQPERKRGKWKDFCGSYQCSCCNMTNAYEENFCLRCRYER